MDYTANQSAQGLASLGRGNDSMLVHMTPREVQGLQGLAMAHGGSLSVNPQTGLPEAGFLDSILPMAAGFALGPGGFGLFSSPLMAGLAVGGITALTSGDLGKGVMAGLGAGSGAGLGDIFSKMGTQSVGGIAPAAAQDAVKSAAIQTLPTNVAQNAATNLGMFNAPGATAAMGGVGATVPTALQSLSMGPSTIGPGVNSAVNAMGAAPTSTQLAQSTLAAPVSGFEASAKGFGKFMEDPLGKGFEAFKVAGGEEGKPLTTGAAAMKLGSPIASLALSGMEPPTYEGYKDPDTGKYRGPAGQLNLSDRFDTGLRLAEGGTISTGGIRDLYGSSDNQTEPAPSLQGYGLGRLNNLASEQAMTKAQALGYAEGGDVGSAPSSDVAAELAISAIDPSRVRGDIVDDRAGLPYAYERILTRGALDFPRITPIEYSPYTYAGALKNQERYAEGGDVGMNLDELPTLNVNTGMQSYGGSNMPEGLDRFRTAMSMAGEMNTINPGARVFSRMMSGLLSGDPEMIGMIQGKGAPSSLIRGFDDPAYANNPQWAVPAGYVPTAPAFSINPSGNTNAQHSALTRKAKGGYLDGAGDGMSDSIPATIEGKQPARLADGEFVIPADVVSHLGNGSSKAGSKRLYAMLDKVRHARTGTKKQGKEIKPEKYMPA